MKGESTDFIHNELPLCAGTPIDYTLLEKIGGATFGGLLAVGIVNVFADIRLNRRHMLRRRSTAGARLPPKLALGDAAAAVLLAAGVESVKEAEAAAEADAAPEDKAAAAAAAAADKPTGPGDDAEEGGAVCSVWWRRARADTRRYKRWSKELLEAVWCVARGFALLPIFCAPHLLVPCS